MSGLQKYDPRITQPVRRDTEPQWPEQDEWNEILPPILSASCSHLRGLVRFWSCYCLSAEKEDAEFRVMYAHRSRIL